jgi:hypothetical protein
MKLNILKNNKLLLKILLSCCVYGQSMAAEEPWPATIALLNLNKLEVQALEIGKNGGAILNGLCDKALKAIDSQSNIDLILLDSVDLANQCHLNALLVVLLAHRSELKPLEKAYSALDLLRSYIIVMESSSASEWDKTLVDTLQLAPSEEKLIRKQLWEKGALHNHLCVCVRQRLNAIRLTLIQQMMKGYLPDNGLESVLWQDDKHNLSNVIPKMVGIDIFIKAIKATGLRVVLSCLNSKQQKSTCLLSPDLSGLAKDSGGINPDTPVIVIHGKSDWDRDIIWIIKRLNYLHNASPESLIRAIAACWMETYQPLGVVAIQKNELINKQYQYWLVRAQAYGVSYQKDTVTSYAIEHIYPDTYGHVIE